MSEEHKLEDEHAPDIEAVKDDHAAPDVAVGETVDAVAVEAEEATAEAAEAVESAAQETVETVEAKVEEAVAEVQASSETITESAVEAETHEWGDVGETIDSAPESAESAAAASAEPEPVADVIPETETVTISASEPASSPTEEAVAAAAPLQAADAAGKGGKGANETFEIFKTVAAALLIAMVIRTVFFQPFTIPSASMEPNLYEGDYIVVSKWSYGYSKHALPFSPPLFSGRIMASEPKRGDIIVFKWPGDNNVDYIKRVIGLPGDTVQMINNQLYLNGQLVPDVETTAQEVAGVLNPQPVIQLTETLPGGPSFTIQDFGPGNPLDNTERFTVPAGHYFMIGDNRDNSLDSRAPTTIGGVGLVPAENLVGKAEIILASWKPGASLWKPWTWFNVRGDRFFRTLH